jgi:excisionase family DNA binding protein
MEQQDLPDKLTGAVSNHTLLTVGDVAEMLQVPPSWVYEHTRQRSMDRIPAFRLGKYWRFREADVLAWIERQRVGARPNA